MLVSLAIAYYHHIIQYLIQYIEFQELFHRFMPCLKYMIGNANTAELRLLRGKTIECVSLIGLAVGGEKFAADASEVSHAFFVKNFQP